jgi:hypothetical protein
MDGKKQKLQELKEVEEAGRSPSISAAGELEGSEVSRGSRFT